MTKPQIYVNLVTITEENLMKNFIIFAALETTYKEICIFSFPLKIFLAAIVTRKRFFHYQFRQSYCADREFIIYILCGVFLSSCYNCHIHMLQFQILLIFKAQMRLQNEAFKYITEVFRLWQFAKKKKRKRKRKKKKNTKNTSFQLFPRKFYHFFQKSRSVRDVLKTLSNI